MKVGEIPGDVQLHHLAIAAREIFRAHQPAFEEKEARVELLAGPDQALIGTHVPNFGDQ